LVRALRLSGHIQLQLAIIAKSQQLSYYSSLITTEIV
jgi:hypothetical protein